MSRAPLSDEPLKGISVPTKRPDDDEPTTAEQLEAASASTDEPLEISDADDSSMDDAADVDAAADDAAAEDVEDRDEVVVKERNRRPAGAASAAAKRAGRASTEAGSGGRVGAEVPRRQVTLSVRTLVLGAVGLLVAAGLLFGVVDNLRVRSQLTELRDQNANHAKAEQVAGEYAVRAATLDYKDLTPWASNLKKGVSPQLSKQFDVAVPAMQQILTPIRMSTTATLVSAATTDVAGDVYRVTAVVDVTTKSLQSPDGATSLAAYVLTLNKADDWMITAVGDQAAPGSPRLPGLPQRGGQETTTPNQPRPAPGG